MQQRYLLDDISLHSLFLGCFFTIRCDGNAQLTVVLKVKQKKLCKLKTLLFICEIIIAIVFLCLFRWSDLFQLHQCFSGLYRHATFDMLFPCILDRYASWSTVYLFFYWLYIQLISYLFLYLPNSFEKVHSDVRWGDSDCPALQGESEASDLALFRNLVFASTAWYLLILLNRSLILFIREVIPHIFHYSNVIIPLPHSR